MDPARPGGGRQGAGREAAAGSGHLRARAVFVDIDPETLNIDPERVGRALNRRTRAVIPVHIGGLPCAMDAIGALSRRRGVPIIEDAAHALGASVAGRRIGSISDMT